MSKKTNNKQVRRNPNTEVATCQTTNLDEQTKGIVVKHSSQTKEANPNSIPALKEKEVETTSNLNFSRWFKNTILPRFPHLALDIVVVVLVECIGRAINQQEFIFQLLVTIGCITVVILVLFALAQSNTFQKEILSAVNASASKMDMFCADNTHIRITSIKKQLKLSLQKPDTSAGTKDQSEIKDRICCDVKHTMQICNCGNDMFEDYIYSLSSTEGVSDIQRFTYYFDNKGPVFSIPPDKCLGYSTTSNKYDNKWKKKDKCTRKGIQLSIPVKVAGRKSRAITVDESDSPSFGRLNECAETGADVGEWMVIAIYYPTDLLQFEIVLDESMKDYRFMARYDYPNLSDSLHPKSYSTSEGCVILDQSEQKVTSEMNALSKGRLEKPTFEVDDQKQGCKRVLWNIPNPKIGYKYLLYFTLSKK